MKKRISFLLALALLLTSCGGGSGAAATATAATMHLRRTEGTVSVADGEGKSVKPTKDLGLFSGYGVDTQAESYAWIDLDEVKLTKLDQNSEVEIQKEDKRLTIEVKSGSLFFNVTEPLAEDESLEIRCSTMVVGIRGTCGWVTDKTAALLEGVVTVTAGEQEVTISAGEMAVMTAEGALEVKPLSADSIPDFVREEQGRMIRSESFWNGEFDSDGSGTFNNTYDAEGRLIRTDMYEADGASKGYALYEYD